MNTKQTFDIGNAKGLTDIIEKMHLDYFVTLCGFRIIVTCHAQDLIEMGIRLQRANVKAEMV